MSCPKPTIDASLFCPKPKQEANWKAAPIVRICSKNPAYWKRVDNAIAFWKSLGHEFASVNYGDDTQWCYGNTMITSIVIKEDIFFDPRTFGETMTMTMGDSVIGARIKIKSGHFVDPYILEHELGHALGYKHIKCGGHIMDGHTDTLGDSTRGLQNERKEKTSFVLKQRRNKTKSVVTCQDSTVNVYQ
tara:strand:+ start:295 stop:861 length:567 start_codon:yes stop_codon:yes gene_type:complete